MHVLVGLSLTFGILRSSLALVADPSRRGAAPGRAVPAGHRDRAARDRCGAPPRLPSLRFERIPRPGARRRRAPATRPRGTNGLDHLVHGLEAVAADERVAVG